MRWIDGFRSHYREVWFPRMVAAFEAKELEGAATYAMDALRPLSETRLQALRDSFAGIPPEVFEFYANVGAGRLHLPNEDLLEGPSTYVICDAAAAEARRESAIAQLQQDIHDSQSGANCHDTGHLTGSACRRALESHRDMISSFLPFMGPDDVHDFFYIALTGPWKGRVGLWFHDYPICELLAAPPEYESFDTFGQHVTASAKKCERLM